MKVASHRIRNIGLLFVVNLTISPQLYADYIFSAPPRESASRGAEIYGPIANKLSTLLGEKVVYEQASSWAAYAKNMRSGRYDIVFDGPHFNGWRQRHINHTPIVALPGDLSFLIITKKEHGTIKTPRDLIGKSICGFPSPHLGTDLVYAMFNNPVLQPIIYEVKGGQKQAYQAFKQGKCHATIFRESLYKKLPPPERNTTRIVAVTSTLPNQTFSISKRLLKNRARIMGFLTSKEGASTANELLSRYSKNAKYFTQAPAKKHYAAAADVLEGVVWGW
jgi:ABC-type phosphate/phosphonate transport system substrate-binding protein